MAAMLEAMGHRGPDGSGTWTRELGDSRRLTLGHRRLAILDLSDAGAQPMQDASGELTITFNGEIYNYLEVRAELAASGARFRSSSDTEVILAAYARWGDACLERLNGMFAFAIHDSRRERLFCARDRFGEKPFLFSARPDAFVFASEYKALLLHPSVSLDHDELRLVRSAYSPAAGLDSERRTVFAHVEQLLPGEALEVDLRAFKPRIWRYWGIAPPPLREAAREADVCAEFRELLRDAVRLRLRSDVPVGSCLSGGLDSSSIVCLARGLLGEDAPYQTFTGRFPGTSADEWEHASIVIDHARATAHVALPVVERFLDELPAFVWHNELPVGGSSQYAQWCVFRLAKERGVTVLLDGQGADELLGGYEQYFAPYVDSLRERGDLARLERELPRIRERYPLALVPPARALRDRLPFPLRRLLSRALGTGTNLLYGLRPEAAREVMRTAAAPRRPAYSRLADSLERDSFSRSLTSLLRYGDRNSMAHSREVRLPFCDHRIAELAFSLPPHLLMGDAQTKRLLRESMRGILPEPVRARWNKQGFRPPQDLWFRSPRMLEAAQDVFGSASFRSSRYWSAVWWQKALERTRRGELSLAWALWQPFIIESWKAQFLAPVAAARSRAASGRGA